MKLFTEQHTKDVLNEEKGTTNKKVTDLKNEN
jgi:hypothetical protein